MKEYRLSFVTMTKITQDELDERLNAYELWLSSDRKKGGSSFQCVDLTGLCIKDRDLRLATFSSSILTKTKFINTNLIGADFNNAKFDQTLFSKVNFGSAAHLSLDELRKLYPNSDQHRLEYEKTGIMPLLYEIAIEDRLPLQWRHITKSDFLSRTIIDKDTDLTNLLFKKEE
jgi:hypothetical protein